MHAKKISLSALPLALLVLCLLAAGCTGDSASPAPAPAVTALVTTPAPAQVTTPVTPEPARAIATTAAPVATIGVVTALPAGADSVDGLLKNRVYEKEISVWGEASEVGASDRPCFILTQKGMSVYVWYDGMVRPEGTPMPALSIKGLKNEQRVLVTGVLKSGTEGGSRNDFWASSISIVAGG